MKKTLCVILALMMVLSFALAGCSGSGAKTTITVWSTPLSDNLEELINTYVIPQFQETHKNVEVDLQILTWEGVSDKLQVALSTGATPDVFLDGTARTASLPDLGVLEPVDDIIASFDDWYDSVLNIGVVEGTHYLVPATTIACSRLNVNVTLAKELGVYDLLPEDKVSWNIQDFYNFVEAAAQAGKDQGIYGTYLYAGSSTSDDILYSLMLSNGGSIVDKETMTCTANSPECVEVVEVLGNIVKNGYAIPGAATAMGGDASTPFLNRQYVLSLNMSAANMMSGMLDMKEQGYMDEADECANYGIPTANGSDMVSASWGANCFAIFTNDGNETKIAAAKDFVKTFIGSEEVASGIWEKSASYTPVRDCGVTYKNDNPKIAEAVMEHAEWSGKYADSSFGILESYWPEVRNCFYPELQAVFTGEKTAQEAMDSFVANVNKALESYK